jgi:hypothetical protein
MAGLGLKSWVPSFPSLPPIFSIGTRPHLVSFCVPLFLSSRTTKAHLQRPLPSPSVSNLKAHVLLLLEKAGIMAEKFMTGALYEACYVV